MKIVIFGATGATGQQIVDQALEQGFTTTVLVRDPQKITRQADNLKVIQGDMLDPAKVSQAVQGADLVISALGVRKLDKNTMLSQGTGNILAAMHQHGVKRLIAVSSVGVGNSKAQAKTMGLVFNRFMMPILLKNVFVEKELQEQLISQSGLDWTIVRPASLTDDVLTGKYQVTTATDFAINGKISRADVAHYILQEAQTNTAPKDMVTVSY